MPLIAFMGVAYVQRDGGHIRMDHLIGALRAGACGCSSDPRIAALF